MPEIDLKDFTTLLKNLKKNTDGFKTIKLAVLADSASQFAVKAIKATGIEHGIKYDVFEADYNQIDRQVFDPTSELYEFEPEYVLILRSTEKLIKQFYHLPGNARANFALDQAAGTADLYRQITDKLNAKVIINTYPEHNDSVFGNFSGKTNLSFPYQIKRLNLGLMDLSQEQRNLFLLQLDSLLAYSGYAAGFDAKMYINGDMVYSLDLLPALAKNVQDIIQAASGTFKKCLILDLDNTTWGGIIGDDGIEGIQIGDLGIGKAFSELQLWALELKKRGIILAVSSKNTEEIAKEPFEKHPDMKLRLTDIAVFMANWENKVDNLRHIQSVLNISFDSMVFLDDNPFEREMVKSAIPELTVPSLPEDPAEYLPYLRSLNLFETVSFTAEDGQRTLQYQEEAQRSSLQKSFTNEAEFLQSLEMKAVIKPFDKFTIPRIAQLSQRSNQFNLRTIRYTEDGIRAIAASDEYFTFSFNLTDKFGDYGLIAFVILKKKNAGTLFIDSWIMSCRVLKRGMELLTLTTIVDLAQKNGFKILEGEYLPTPKNGMVKDHYEKLGFSATGEGKWELAVDGYAPANKLYINTAEA
ncbi:MAG TPA: HAD-IIIC family phosphatase [Mucilaginibacter sp.]